jgi:DNA-binding NtrC family response regulator
VQPTDKISKDPLRILVVDDETSLLDSIIEQLTRLGHSAEGYSSARQACGRLTTEKFDIILTDIRMPDLDGPAFYEEVIAREPLLGDRFIFITGDSLNQRANRFIKSKNALCLDKPFKISNLQAAIEEVMKRIDHRADELSAEKNRINSL